MWWAVPLTLGVYFVARFISFKLPHPLFNPLFLAIIFIIIILLWLHIPYITYAKESAVINYLLQPAVVALAYPLYELLPKIKKQWRSLCIICIVSSLLAMSTGAIIAALLGASPQIVASVLPKSVTTPISIAVSAAINGIPSISSACVILVGIIGAVFGQTILTRCKINYPAARGLAMGSVSHALGTARCMEIDIQQGAYSSLALVFCGIFTSIFAPFVFHFIYFLMY